MGMSHWVSQSYVGTHTRDVKKGAPQVVSVGPRFNIQPSNLLLISPAMNRLARWIGRIRSSLLVLMVSDTCVTCFRVQNLSSEVYSIGIVQ